MLKDTDLEPDIGPFAYYIDAFRELGTCRNSSMSTGPIPFTAIVEYSTIYEIEDFEEFSYLIRRLDDTLLDLEAKKSKTKEGASSGNGSKTDKNKR